MNTNTSDCGTPTPDKAEGMPGLCKVGEVKKNSKEAISVGS